MCALVPARAGVLVLEELGHARARGAPVLAEFLGGSFTCDAHHMTEPHPQGAGVQLCIEKCVLAVLGFALLRVLGFGVVLLCAPHDRAAPAGRRRAALH